MKSQKYFYPSWLLLLVFVLLAGCVPLQPAPEAAAPPSDMQGLTADVIGTVDFPTSCSAEAQSEFTRGVALLHSFYFPPAISSFESALDLDPTCAMAHWGIAMSRLGIPWSPTPDEAVAAGKVNVEQALALGGQTDREQAYVDAIAAFYNDADGQTFGERAKAYEAAMAQLVQDFPDDKEGQIFYALALLITGTPPDKEYTNQYKAMAILDPLFSALPHHPGIPHYLIHSHDVPALAEGGMDAALVYADIAPAAPHAQHMPSHIFTRRGLWHESVASNQVGVEAAKGMLPADAPAGTTNEDALHAQDYMMYGYLQLALDSEPKALLDEINAITTAGGGFGSAYALAAIPARYVLERKAWDEAAALTLSPYSFAWDRFPHAEAILVFARGLGAARAGDVATANAANDRLAAIHEALVAANNGYWAGQVAIGQLEVAAWVALAAGDQAEALRLMQEATVAEDLTEKHPVTPGPIKPAHELLGEMHLELGDPAAALAEFETAQGIEPNRFWGWYDAAKAAEQAGDLEKAKGYYSTLVEMVGADSTRPEVAEAQAFLAR
ncbi:MAG TPA: hypothetical protein P5121_34050 [Caldilineaceae bacterium]|nr:hypothetical protein [Caldilineaceae bacterium]